MKKIFYFVLLVSVLALTTGIAIAADTIPPPTTETVKYTKSQKACLKVAQDVRLAAIKTATDALNDATKDALKIRQDAMKAAADTLNNTTKNVLKVEQDAMAIAQKLTDAKARADAIKAANDAYNSNAIVKAAKVPYVAAVKAINDVYNNSAEVKAAKAPYLEAVKAANDKFQIASKTCLISSGNAVGRFFKKIGDGVSGSFTKMIKFFSGKK